LSVRYVTERGIPTSALDEVGFAISPGEIVGVLGESGSGKSTLAAALLGLLPTEANITGSIVFRGREIVGRTSRELRSIRGCDVAMVHQDPSLSLNPVLRVGTQIEEVLRAHKKMSGSDRTRQAKDALRHARIQDVDRVFASHPHQLSGGERLRVTLAQAIVCGPRLLIADEPTSSVDPTIQSSILRTFCDLQRELGTAMLLITHDPAILAGVAQQILILHRGKVVEQGMVSQVFAHPKDPYAQQLMNLVPRAMEARA
jgi:ABC-type glutathione transport system ATPase component